MSAFPTDFACNSPDYTLGRGNVTAGLLVIDRTPEPILTQLRPLFTPPHFEVAHAVTGRDALERVRANRPRVILIDPELPDLNGLEVHQEIRGIDAAVPVIFTAATPTADSAIAAMKQGAYDYLHKPIEGVQLHRAVVSALKSAPSKEGPSGKTLRIKADLPGATFIGHSGAMRDVCKSISQVAGQDVNVLITGESGTGKELVARAIWQHSARGTGGFLALNCAAIPETLLESELFGHEKGAFSGADRRRIGKFEQCDGGTILLDEIGDMPLLLQAKILRLLQDQSFERVGGNKTINTNVRLIASTHKDLGSMVRTGRFRQDLYYRLSVFKIHLPPLRNREEDLPTLITHFVNHYAHQFDMPGISVSADAMSQLARYRWPGNVRELQSVVQQALLRSAGDVLTADDVSDLLADVEAADADAPDSRFDIAGFLNGRLSADAFDLYAELHRELDRRSLCQVLNFTRGNQHLAAKILGIARQTLRTKMREAGVRVASSAKADELRKS